MPQQAAPGVIAGLNIRKIGAGDGKSNAPPGSGAFSKEGAKSHAAQVHSLFTR
jgi:hypothetical protein